ncbi:ATP-dependent Clp protease ATP-binding subunit ClpA [Candidatus Marinamargulisbacteria bacterium SCGC AAA071-K20]|nr:ATP-dependent Clp protease ATP-binding subunit ClpA [Candidatus Marinamargulisbacteria bacterium SCGC AAA071-K20]
MNTNDELEFILERSFAEASKYKKQYVTSEHILVVLLSINSIKTILVNYKIDSKKLQNELKVFIEHRVQTHQNPSLTRDPELSLGVKMVLSYASTKAKETSLKQIKAHHILLSLFRDKHSHAIYFLSKYGIKQNTLEQDINNLDSQIITSNDEDPIHKYCDNLSEKAASGTLDTLVDRQTELTQIFEILSRRKKNNPLLIGDPGVGKSAIIEGLATLLLDNQVNHHFKNATVLSLNISSLIAGTKYRGEFEERLDLLIKSIKTKKNIVLVLEDIHNLIGAGAISAGSMDASGLLKPFLSSGEIKCIGTTTYKDFKQVLEKEPTFTRRFNKIDIEELSTKQTLRVLENSKHYYEDFHGVRYSLPILEAIITLSDRFLTSRRFPDKAIDLLDSVGAKVSLNKDDKKIKDVEISDVEDMLGKRVNLPNSVVKLEDKELLLNLEPNLKSQLFGQDEAIEKVVESIIFAKSGLKDPNKPIGTFLFAGPTGVGKTEFAKQLASFMNIDFSRFDMSEYSERHAVSRLIGSPPGYIGYEQGGLLTAQIEKTPHCVILFDEIEKAHPDVHNILLQAMDYATLTDNNGEKSNLKSVIIILTSNSGAYELSQIPIGFKQDQNQSKSLRAIEKSFSPEFRNRLNAIIQFNSLTKNSYQEIIEKHLVELKETVKEQGKNIIFDENIKYYILTKGVDSQNGARKLKQFIDDKVAVPLSKVLLFASLNNNQTIRISYINNEINVEPVLITSPVKAHATVQQ